MPRVSNKLKVACIYWKTKGVGGIATHLNNLRKAAIDQGDTFDILHTFIWKRKNPTLFPQRKWVPGGDTNIWVDGEFSDHEDKIAESVDWINNRYDAIHFGYLCPHHNNDYPVNTFMPLYEGTPNLPKTTTITDGYWESYREWGTPCLPYLRYITTSGIHYAGELIEQGIKVDPLGMPFIPAEPPYAAKSKTPLIVWPNQWKDIKGIKRFLKVIPNLPSKVQVELYSCGIRYYQLRSSELWENAIRLDKFKGFNGKGRGVYFGNVDYPEVCNALQRAWFTVNLQGMSTKKVAYQKGSYNNTELEALYYGAIPILHESTLGTDIPPELYRTVQHEYEIPKVVKNLISEGAIRDTKRASRAKEWVMDNYSAKSQYLKLRKHWI